MLSHIIFVCTCVSFYREICVNCYPSSQRWAGDRDVSGYSPFPWVFLTSPPRRLPCTTYEKDKFGMWLFPSGLFNDLNNPQNTNRHIKKNTYLAGCKESVVCLCHIHVVIVGSKLQGNRLFQVTMQMRNGLWRVTQSWGGCGKNAAAGRCESGIAQREGGWWQFQSAILSCGLVPSEKSSAELGEGNHSRKECCFSSSLRAKRGDYKHVANWPLAYVIYGAAISQRLERKESPPPPPNHLDTFFKACCDFIAYFSGTDVASVGRLRCELKGIEFNSQDSNSIF